MRNLTLLLLFTLLVGEVHAQYINQAMKYSQQYYTGTARSQAMGNAFGALGGDFTSISINPAGLGVYRTSEFSTTIAPMRLSSMESQYEGYKSTENNYNFSFRNVGYVGASKPNSSSVVNVNFALGYNRMNNFNFERTVSASGVGHSKMEHFAAMAGNTPSDNLSLDNDYAYTDHNWEAVQAYNAYLINPEGDGYVANFDPSTETINQLEHYKSDGALDEILMSLGVNIQDKLYLGASVSMYSVNNTETYSFSEDGAFGYYDQYKEFETTGVGVNAKFGMIYRPTPSIRLGAAFHTPTYFNLKENVYYSMHFEDVYYLEKQGEEETVSRMSGTENSPEGQYEYQLQTPMRAVFSGAFMIGRVAMLSVDYEMVNYQNTELSDDYESGSFRNENQIIEDVGRKAYNLRSGLEFRATKNVSLRAGYEYYSSPFQGDVTNDGTYYFDNDINQDRTFNKGSLGFGYRNKDFFVDVAYSITKSDGAVQLYHVYDIDEVNIVDQTTTKETINELLFTVGFRF